MSHNSVAAGPSVPTHVYFAFALSLITLSQAALLVRGSQATPEVLGFWRLFFAVLLSVGLVRWNKQEFLPQPLKPKLGTVLVAGFLFWLHFWLWFHSVALTTIANSTLLFCMNPLFVAIGSVIFEKERISGRLIFAIVMGLIGLVVMQKDALQFSRDRIWGDSLALLASIAFAGYLLMVKRLRQEGSNFTLTFWFNLVSFVGFGVVVAFSEGKLWGYGWISWACFLGMALGPSLLGHGLFTYSLKYLNTAWASCFVLTEPLMAAVSAAIIFHEKVPAGTTVAFAIITLGLLNLFVDPRKWRGRRR